MNGLLADTPELFEPSEDAALFFPREELKKRYTARQADKVESVRNLVLMAVSAGWPIEDVARAAHVSTRTVQALAARESEKVAGNVKQFSQALHTLGARWYGLARAKEHDATFIQLAQAASFAVQRGSELLAVGHMGEETGENVIQSEQGGGEILDRVRQLLGRTTEPGESVPADCADGSSLVPHDDPVCLQADRSGVVAGDAVAAADQVPMDATATERIGDLGDGGGRGDRREGGGSRSGHPLETSICPEKRGDLANGSGLADSAACPNE